MKHGSTVLVARHLLAVICLILFLPNPSITLSAQDAYIPEEGFVPDKETAIRIAVAVWIPIYGEENISKQKPYNAQLVSGAWIVTGSLPQVKPGLAVLGGVAYAEISKKDARILRVYHGS